MKSIQKDFCILILLVFYIGNINAQMINKNPDPMGNPWIVGGAPAGYDCYDIGINFTPTEASFNKPLPASVYNNNLNINYLPPVYNQLTGENSCLQVCEIYYTLSYELNRKRNIPAGTNNNHLNMYHPLYTYNLLNGGSNSGTYWGDGFNLVKENGCPSYSDFWDIALFNPSSRLKYWMNGASQYNAGMNNTISTIYQFEYDTSVTNLNYLKHWIADHGTGSTTGGLIIISVNALDWVESSLPNGSPHATDAVITQLGTTGSHGITLVGYDDSIWALDINQDGQYTNNVDLNNDGYINIMDFEKGAFYFINSWGTGSGTDGYYYLPYALLWSTPSLQNPGLTFCHPYSCDVFNNPLIGIPSPEITINANIEYEERQRLYFSVGYRDINSTLPISKTDLQLFNTQGGYMKMRGAYDGPIDLGFNYSHYYKDNQNEPFQRIYFMINESDQNNVAEGLVNSITLVDHRWNEEFELPFEIPNHTIHNGENCNFVDYYLLPHHEYNISSNTELTTNRISRFTTNINTAVLTLANNKEIHMYGGEIFVNYAGSLRLLDNAKIVAKRGYNKIIIDGSLILGSNVQFVTENEALLEIHLNGNNFTICSDIKFLGNGGGYIDLYLNNESGTVTIKNATFERTNVISKTAYLILDNCNIKNEAGYLYSKSGNINCTNSTFTNTGLYLYNSSGNLNELASVDGCTFTNNISGMYGLCIENYGKYSIMNNSIEGYSDGINLYYSGTGVAGNQKIENNVIQSCQMNGIIAYNSIGSVFRNKICNNYYGVRFMNNCNFALHGDPAAWTLSQTQQIENNINCEVYTSEFSFPYYFIYNSIVDPDNLGKPTDPLLHFDRPVYANTTKADVKFNHWGAGFNQVDDLMGNNTIFLTYPTWTPGTIPTTTADEDLYTSASNNFADGNYQVAKSQYQLLIELYPKSKYAEAAIKELMRLEEYSGKDFSGLKAYLLTNDSITADSTLSKLADISANQCDVKLGNWSQAINWYENKILNPSCLEDSVFAIIDLGYVYSLMENQGLKSAYSGNLKQFIPETKEKYFEHRDYLLSLLPIEMMSDKLRNDLTNLSYGSLLQNVPNPFKGKTQIWYKVEKQANVNISVIDMTGKEIKIIEQGLKDKGTYKADFVNSGLTPGTYFYSLELDGKKSDTKKMLIMR
ncbi:MAG: T9SS type A sorting domain-containing protein [Lentimicrobiaceae bacterium]|nr:T9SS type A sorting domain-containing protein [Lentimicrobiaceae bacterium]